MFLVLDAQVELYKGGIVPLSEYAERPKDRDILVRIIVPKKNAKFNYQSVRISQTDIPVLTCASVKDENGYRFAIGARPARAQIYAQPVDKTAEQMAEAVRAEIKTGSSLRGSAEYRRHLAGVLVRRAAHEMCIRDRHHTAERFPRQQRLITRQKHAAGHGRKPRQQVLQSKLHGCLLYTSRCV